MRSGGGKRVPGIPGTGPGEGGRGGGAAFSSSTSRRHYWGLLILLAAFCSGLYVLLYYRATLTTPSALIFPRLPSLFLSESSRAVSPPPLSGSNSSVPQRNVSSASSAAASKLPGVNLSSGFPFATAEDLKEAIDSERQQPLLTLFSTWVDREDLKLVRSLTLRNWAMLRPWVRPVLFTNNTKLESEAKAYGWSVMPVTKTAVGVPILKNMYLDSMSKFNSTLYAFANGDMLFTLSLVDSLMAVMSDASLNASMKGVLAIGQRTNVLNVKETEARTFNNLVNVAKARGKLFITMAEDFFVTDRRFAWDSIPGVVVGRVAYDNWVVLHAIQKGYVVVDLTKTTLAVHQTTRHGNNEGFKHANSSYNDNILRRLYKHIHYRGGCVDCAPWRTLTSSKDTIYVEKKASRPKHCV